MPDGVRDRPAGRLGAILPVDVHTHAELEHVGFHARHYIPPACWAILGPQGGAMAQARGIKPVGYFDCPGGGQVVVDGTTAYVAHMKAPHGTTIVDVRDPANPRKLA